MQIRVQVGETGCILLSSVTEPEYSVPVLHLPFDFDENLVSQLNIEKRPTVGDSLLAAADILKVRSDVCTSRGDCVTGVGESCRNVADNSASNCLYHCQAGLQETAGASVEKQVMPEVIEKNDNRFEIDLSNIINLPQYNASAVLPVLDSGMVEQELKKSGSRSWEGDDQAQNESRVLQPAECEDAIDGPSVDGLLPSSGLLHRTVPDTFSHQWAMVRNGLPCTTNGSSECSVSHSTLTAATWRVGVPDAWKSLPVESGADCRGFREVQAVEQSNEHETRCVSLPMTCPASRVWSSAAQLPSSVSKWSDFAREDVCSGAAYCSEAALLDTAVAAGGAAYCSEAALLDTAGAAGENQAVTEVIEINQPIVQLSEQLDVAQKTPDTQQKCTSFCLPTVNTGPVVKSQLAASVASDRLMPSAVPAKDRILSVRSPMGQITGTMSDLSIDNGRHPLLRGILMAAPAPTITGRDQVTLF